MGAEPRDLVAGRNPDDSGLEHFRVVGRGRQGVSGPRGAGRDGHRAPRLPPPFPAQYRGRNPDVRGPCELGLKAAFMWLSAHGSSMRIFSFSPHWIITGRP